MSGGVCVGGVGGGMEEEGGRRRRRILVNVSRERWLLSKGLREPAI